MQETLGDEVGADMVDWMQGVDARRAELRELNDLAWERMEARFGQIDARFDAMEHRMDALEHRFVGLELMIERQSHSFEAKLERRFADLLKWSFVFWVGAVSAVALLAGALG